MIDDEMISTKNMTLISALSRLYTQATQVRLHPHGISPAALPVLAQLWRSSNLTQARLSELVGVEQPTMANTLKRMERDGLINRTRDNRDRRKFLISPTNRAIELKSALTGVNSEVQQTATTGITESGIKTMNLMLAKMIANLEHDLDQPPLVLDDVINSDQPLVLEDIVQEKD